MLATRSIFVPSRLSYDAMAPMLHAQLGCDIKFGVMEMFNEMHLDMVSVFTAFFIALTEITFVRQGNAGRSFESHQLLGGEVCWDAQSVLKVSRLSL